MASLKNMHISGFDLLLLNIKQEVNDVMAIQDALEQKVVYERLRENIQGKQRVLQLELSRILAGKKSLRSIFTKSSKEQQTQDIEAKIHQVSD